MQTKIFVEKAKKVHGDKYDYSKVAYINSKDKVTITCPEHGDFQQIPNSHLSGKGCKICAVGIRTMSVFQFITRAGEVHKSKYDYSKVEYKTALIKVGIICPKHGIFYQVPFSHLKGFGCWECAVEDRAEGRSLNRSDFVKRATQKHKGKYDYTKVVYKLITDKVEIICPKHGSFWQKATNHIEGRGCKKCKSDSQSIRLSITKKDFVKKANRTHESKYNYSKGVYLKSGDKVEIICSKHGSFWQRPNDHLRRNSTFGGGRGCPRCAHLVSNPEINLRIYIKTLLPDFKIIENSSHKKLIEKDVILCSNKGLIKSLNNIPNHYAELDIVIPKLKLAFEFNGVHYHSTKFKDKDYHKIKSEACAKIGLRLIHIWEDDWGSRTDVLKSFLRSLIKPIPTIFGRKTIYEETTKEIAKEFLNSNHVQGAAGCTKAYALYYEGNVVSICTFIKRGYGYELNRHACTRNFRVVGALGKHIKNFKRLHTDSIIKSFCDLSMFNGGSYEKAGFELEHTLSPDYKYVIRGDRKHKFGFRRHLLPDFLGEKFNPEISEVKNMENNGFYRIFDCGKLRYVYK